MKIISEECVLNHPVLLLLSLLFNIGGNVMQLF